MDKNRWTKLNLILIGIIGGAINGVFGTGAGLVMIPTIKLATKKDERVVHATTLAIVMLMCLVSGTVFLATNSLNFRVIFWCAIGSICGGVIGTIALQKLKTKVIEIIFSFVLVIAGIVMIAL